MGNFWFVGKLVAEEKCSQPEVGLAGAEIPSLSAFETQQEDCVANSESVLIQSRKSERRGRGCTKLKKKTTKTSVCVNKYRFTKLTTIIIYLIIN